MKFLKPFLTIAILILVSCSSHEQKELQPVIMVSILPQKYLAERITGNNFRVNVLVPPGSSAETYEPTPRQMQDVAKSVLYFRIGYMEFESTLVRNLQKQNPGLRFVNTAEGVDLIAAEIADHGDHVHLYGVDPHIWLSIPAVKIQLANMLEAVSAHDPGNKEYYLANYNKFLAELEELHLSLTEKFRNAKRRSFLIYHPALGYFARDYGLTQISVEIDGKSPTASNMRTVVNLARQDDIKDIFIQMEFERDNARAVARELGGNVVEIDPLSEDWMGNMKEMARILYETLNKE
jgi:zinc transport system substrate-binding protein